VLVITPEQQQKITERINKANQEDPETRFFRVDDAIEQGEEVSQEDLDFHGHFLKSHPALMRLRTKPPQPSPAHKVG